ncbi:MAG: ribonuclease H-like domain-containing protein [Chloroflexota bacterium]
MDDRLQSKLRRLGVTRGTRNLKPAPPVKPPRHGSAPPTDREFEQVFPGAVVQETAVGSCLVLDKVYPLSFQQGQAILGELLAYLPEAMVPYAKEPRLTGLHFTDALFIDTETTGLAGAGTLAFMVGVAFFDQQKLANGATGYVFVVRQYFLRNHADEPAMLRLLEELAASKTFLISFNGRSFDIPLLDNRYLMNRQPSPLSSMPHLDLLPPSRRLWRLRLGSCALGSLEETLLSIKRTHEDVPGFLIPNMYHDYVRSGDPSEMRRVFYHNHEDMLSMVTLATAVLQLITQREGLPLDLFSLGKWQADLRLVIEAETTLRQAADAELPLETYHQTLSRLALLLKQNNRRAEAIVLWQQIASTTYDDVDAHVELAKFYEWHEIDYQKATFWTEQGLTITKSWRNRGYGQMVGAELEHRLQRLQRKLTDSQKSSKQQ